jgi:predicted dehydrogenase
MRHLIVGTGSMAETHARAFSAIEGCELVAGVDTDKARLADFCTIFGIEHAFTDLDEAISWGGFDSVSNVTPDRVHHPTTMKLVVAGKHVLCEKPLAENARLADEMTEAAEAAGVINMVNLSYRSQAVMQKAHDLVAEGEIGDIRHVEAAYLQSWLVADNWGDWRTEDRWLWRLSEAHGSQGVLGDVGVHILDFASFVCGRDPVSVHCRLNTFPKAEGDRIGEYQLDANDSFVMSVAFEGGALGTIHASRFATGYVNQQRLVVFGTKGAVEVGFGKGEPTLRICSGDDVHTQAWRPVAAPPVPAIYETYAAAVQAGRQAEPGFRHAARLQKIIDLGFESDSSGQALAVGD